MTTPWTTPTSFVNGVVIGATDLNTHVRDNLGHLKSPPFRQIVTAFGVPPASQPGTTSTIDVPIVAGMSATFMTYGAPVQVFFQMETVATAAVARFNLAIDGALYTTISSGLPNTYHVWVTGLASGTHTFIPLWRSNVGGGVWARSGMPIIFWAREG